jgi:hypothetical protein
MTTISEKCVFDLADKDECNSTDYMVAMDAANAKADKIAGILSEDRVALIHGVSQIDADKLMAGIASEFGLSEDLEIQAGFAAIHGHRKNVGNYFMSVNERGEYSFIPPHSEGNSRMSMQLSSFYCMENTTDGGETVLWGTGRDEEKWRGAKEFKYKIKTSRRTLSKTEIAELRMMHGIDWKKDVVEEDDEVLCLHDAPIEGVHRYSVLEPAKKSFSKILGTDRYVCWDTIGSVDWDIAEGFAKALQKAGLFKTPAKFDDWRELDSSSHRKVWSSGINLPSIFTRAIVRKLRKGELIVMNNMSWAHSACGWTPGSGTRDLVAAFA